MGCPTAQAVKNCESCHFCSANFVNDEEEFLADIECRNPQSEFFERPIDFSDSCTAYGFSFIHNR